MGKKNRLIEDHPDFHENLKFELEESKRHSDAKLNALRWERANKVVKKLNKKLNNRTKTYKKLRKAAANGENYIIFTNWKFNWFCPLGRLEPKEQREVLLRACQQVLPRLKSEYGGNYDLKVDFNDREAIFVGGPIYIIKLFWTE